MYWTYLGVGFERSSRRSGQAVRSGATVAAPAVSVVVSARNEEANLDSLLTKLRAQDYPDFEVVVVNDGSTDATAAIVDQHSGADARVRLVTVEPVQPRKKHAISAGIRAARHSLIALTDADCRPHRSWLRQVILHYEDDYTNRVIVGYGPYDRQPGAVNRVARYENFTTAFLTAAACGLGRPYMAVGRNIGYPRELFERVGGLDATMQSLSGDDDLFVQQAVRHGADVIHMFGAESFVPSPAPGSWSSWVRQKHRHTSAGRYYSRGVQAHIAAFQISGAAMWLAPLGLGWIGAAYFLLRLGVQHAVLRRAAAHFEERDLLTLHPLWDLTYSLYNMVIAPAGVLFSPQRWRTGSER